MKNFKIFQKHCSSFLVNKNLFQLHWTPGFNFIPIFFTGEFSGISIDLVLSRNIRYYFSKFYLPVIVIVLISWTPFWLERVLIIRIYIALCSILFLGWHYLAQPNDLVISHFTYLDYWRGISFLFVLGAAAQSIFITYMIKMNKNKIVRTHPDDSEKFQMLQCKDCPYKVSNTLV